MNFTQKEVMDIIRKSSVRLQSDEFARLFIMKKAENFVRNILVMEFEKCCEEKRKRLDSQDAHLTAVHETVNKHDIAILHGKIGGRKLRFRFSPKTVIEIKFTKASWIIQNKDSPVNEEVVQDNIWKGNIRKSVRNIGKEPGIIRDLIKMRETQKKYKDDVAIHHILVMTSPQSVIDNKFTDIIDHVNGFNDCLQRHNNDHYSVCEDAVHTMRDQLKKVQGMNTFSENNIRFSLCHEVITVGKAFDVALDLIFVVISEEYNLGNK